MATLHLAVDPLHLEGIMKYQYIGQQTVAELDAIRQQLQQELDSIGQQLQSQIDTLVTTYDAQSIALDTVQIAPAAKDITVLLVGVLYQPL